MALTIGSQLGSHTNVISRPISRPFQLDPIPCVVIGVAPEKSKRTLRINR
jgi:hypothetical protein